MTNHLNRSTISTIAALAALTLLVGAAVALAGDDAADSGYSWSAELVAFDAPSRTATLKAMVVGREPGDLTDFGEGDAVILVWSGVISQASGIRSVTDGEMSKERFAMAVEFVSTERDGRYVSFRVPIPAAAVGKIKSLKPGQSVLVTSPHAAIDRSAVVSTIREYTDIG
jgi:hypothetical protein